MTPPPLVVGEVVDPYGLVVVVLGVEGGGVVTYRPELSADPVTDC